MSRDIERRRREHRERQRLAMARRRAEGRCLRCERYPEREDRACCNRCLKYVAGVVNRIAEQRRAVGMCAQCGREPLATTWRCRKCSDALSARQRERYAAKRERRTA